MFLLFLLLPIPIFILLTCPESTAFSIAWIPSKARQSHVQLFSNHHGVRVGTIISTLSISSGISPAIQIISEAHKSRLPDCPIAHDLDTLLLWPVKEESIEMGHRISLFTKPAAAFTIDPLIYIDWRLVIQAFTTRCIITGFICTLIVYVFYTLQKAQTSLKH